ncbi:hypothetical protein M569_05970 [Genlisea aurea]|uniref:Uncharacterized protein n=1 Tax=Genlisea aurea TaxID=192259 RepID=S8CV72_9LAMI|nr:hypothetical protein M569_05970 [Genlisea aurea]
MPKQIHEIKDFLLTARRKDARSVKIKRSKDVVKFKVRCSKYLYTLCVFDPEKADKLKQSLPPDKQQLPLPIPMEGGGGASIKQCTLLHQPQSGATPSDGPKWSEQLLRDCATAIVEKDSIRIRRLLWLLNELSSPYGDCEEKLAYYFMQAFLFHSTGFFGRETLLTAAAEKAHCFDSVVGLILKFQEVSPWLTFGHVASNGAILEAMEGERKIHVLDMSNTLCTQWPTFLEALATRCGDAPEVKITVVALTPAITSVMNVDIAPRMRRFARLMGVPFEFDVIDGLMNKDSLKVRNDEALIVNCIGALRGLELDERKPLIRTIKSLAPKVVTAVEEELDFSSSKRNLVERFEGCFRFYTLYLDMLEDCFPATSEEKLILERECSRTIMRLVCRDDRVGEGETKKEENEVHWSGLFRDSGFSTIAYSTDVMDDVKALIKKHRSGWSMVCESWGMYLTWKDEPVVWSSSWK